MSDTYNSKDWTMNIFVLLNHNNYVQEKIKKDSYVLYDHIGRISDHWLSIPFGHLP